MTTQDDKPGADNRSARTQLRPRATDWTLRPKGSTSEDQIYVVREQLHAGREDCEIPVMSNTASRRHARLFLSEGALHVQDLQSANGTFVNGERVDVAELQPGDEVCFDTEPFVVGGPQPPDAESSGGAKKTVLRESRATDGNPEQAAAPAEDDRRTAVSSASSRDEPAQQSGAGASDATPDSATQQESPAEAEPSPADVEAADAQGGAWYERATPNQTRKLDADDVGDQVTEGGTKVVRGVRELEMPSLIGTSDDWAGHVVNLEKDSMTIGRSGTDIILDEASVSTKHAQIVREDDRWKVIDLMSANGVRVNGKKTQVAFLSPGDAIRFGRLEMRFVTDSTQVPSRASPGADDATSPPSSTQGLGSWVYFLVGFVVVLGAGAYVLFATDLLGAGGLK